MVRLKHPWRWLGILATAAFLSYGAWYSWGPRHTPRGQPPMGQLSAAAMPTFLASFNAQPDDPRLLLLLSPT